MTIAVAGAGFTEQAAEAALYLAALRGLSLKPPPLAYERSISAGAIVGSRSSPDRDIRGNFTDSARQPR